MLKTIVVIIPLLFTQPVIAALSFHGEAGTALYNCLDLPAQVINGVRRKEGQGFRCEAIRGPMSGWESYFARCEFDNVDVLMNTSMMLITDSSEVAEATLSEVYSHCTSPESATSSEATTVKTVHPALKLYKNDDGFLMSLSTSDNP
jgi:hypothetical protein